MKMTFFPGWDILQFTYQHWLWVSRWTLCPWALLDCTKHLLCPLPAHKIWNIPFFPWIINPQLCECCWDGGSAEAAELPWSRARGQGRDTKCSSSPRSRQQHLEPALGLFTPESGQLRESKERENESPGFEKREWNSCSMSYSTDHWRGKKSVFFLLCEKL